MKRYFTIHNGDVGSEAFRDEYVKAVETERDEAIAAIRDFAEKHNWAADIWKQQPHIKRLFDIANDCMVGANSEHQ